MTSQDFFSQETQINARLRGEYDSQALKLDKCVFCDLKDKYIVYEQNEFVVTVNIFPYIDGHLLVIPRRHVENFEELTDQEILSIAHLSNKATKILKNKLNILGTWFILRNGELGPVSGKTVKHLHWQILPYTPNLNTWHYQTITIPPIQLADKLRPEFNNE